MRRNLDRAAEYRRLAQESSALAQASLLDHVREKHTRAAATWTALAQSDERPLEPPTAAASTRPPKDKLCAI